MDVKIPNLDGLTDDDLAECGEAFAALDLYASQAWLARQLRRKGNIPDARRAEALAEEAYQRLPVAFRW